MNDGSSLWCASGGGEGSPLEEVHSGCWGGVQDLVHFGFQLRGQLFQELKSLQAVLELGDGSGSDQS